MDPINPLGTIAPFTSPRHGFPLIAEGIVKPVASLAYVDDATRHVAIAKALHSMEECYSTPSTTFIVIILSSSFNTCSATAFALDG